MQQPHGSDDKVRTEKSNIGNNGRFSLDVVVGWSTEFRQTFFVTRLVVNSKMSDRVQDDSNENKFLIQDEPRDESYQ